MPWLQPRVSTNTFFISPLREPAVRLEKKDLPSQSGLVPLTIKSPQPASYKFASPFALNLTFFFSSVVPPPRLAASWVLELRISVP